MIADDTNRTAGQDTAPGRPRALIVIPCLNEARHIGGLLRQQLVHAAPLATRIVVADGGSTDGTVEIVRDLAAGRPGIELLHNPRRIQSAAMNLAVRTCGAGARYVIRLDAHCSYPDDYCARMIEEAEATGAASVVVGMIAAGDGLVQSVTAEAQNSRIGNGGSKHRRRPAGEYVDHGHHALMRTDVFAAVGGYDEAFRCNEDAEFDHRIRKAGHHIWLTARTVATYHPRTTFTALFRQYFTHGQGRARTILKHRLRPVARQAAVLAVAPALVLAGLAVVTPLAVVPAALWVAACLAGGIAIAVQAGRPQLVLSAVAAMIMHAAWSFGFWQQLLFRRGNAPPRVTV